MGELADELVLLMLPTDKYRQIGYRGDGSRSTICGALLAEDWVNGGPAPSEDEFVDAIRREVSHPLERVVDPLVAAGRIEADSPRKKLFGFTPAGNLPDFKVHDVAPRDAVVHRMESSLEGTEPPPLRDAALGAILVAGKHWDKTGLDGPEPRPRRYAGSDPPPWGPLMQCAQQITAGQVVPAGVTPEVLPMIARRCATRSCSAAACSPKRRERCCPGQRSAVSTSADPSMSAPDVTTHTS